MNVKYIHQIPHHHHATNEYNLLIIYPGSVHSMKLTFGEDEDSDEDNAKGYKEKPLYENEQA